MALNQRDAIEAARNIMSGPRIEEARRLDRIACALKPGEPTVALPAQITPTMAKLASKSQTNYLPLVLDTLAQVLKVEGYRTQGASLNARPWQNWQRNGIDARQTGVHRSALAYGASYVKVLPGDTGPSIRGVSPRNMTALYQKPSEDDWPMLALEVDGAMLTLYDEERAYYIGAENAPRSGFTPMSMLGAPLEYIESRKHGLGVCPVVRFRDRMLLEGEEQYGIIEPIISIQQRIDETTFGMLVAQYFAAFRQRYIIGWVPKVEGEELRASATDVWTFEDDTVKVGDFAETDLTRYLDSKNSAVRDMAAISQVPAQGMGVDGVANISAEALASLEAGKDRKADEIATSLGESWEQVLRTAAVIDGDNESAEDFTAQVRWKNATARSLAQTADALGKMVQMLGVPPQAAWAMIPGVNDLDIAEWTKLAAENDSIGNFTRLIEEQAAGLDNGGA